MNTTDQGLKVAPLAASHQAGRKLVLIVAILFIPLLLLGYFLFKANVKDLRTTQTQIAGTEYLRQFSPVLYSLARNDVVATRAAAADMQQRSWSSNLSAGVRRDEAELVARLGQEPFNLSQLLADARDLYRRVASDTGIVMDANTARHFLADAYVKQLPDLALLVTGAADEAGSERFNGEFTAFQNSTFEAISTAIKADDSGQFAAELNPRFAELDAAMEGYKDSMVAGQTDTDWQARRGLFSATEKLAVTGSGVLLGSLQDDADAAIRAMTIVGATCLGAIAVALLFAAKMFYSTFHKLDDAELARVQLEDMNSSIAKLNVELAENFRVLKDAQDDNIKKSKMAQIGALTAMVAHELRNPLGAVRNSTFLISKKMTAAGLSLEKPIERINSAVTRCDGIITQLLEFTTETSLQPRLGCLDDWVVEEIETCAKAIPNEVAIRCELGLGSTEANFDPSALSRVVCALMRNAAQSFGAASPREKLITVSSTLVNGQIRLDIADTGLGISIENLDKVMEPLFTTKSFGPGLGLPIAKQLVDQHGGSLMIRSVLDRGTVVSVILPGPAQSALAA